MFNIFDTMNLEENGWSHRDQLFSDYIPREAMAPAEVIWMKTSIRFAHISSTSTSTSTSFSPYQFFSRIALISFNILGVIPP